MLGALTAAFSLAWRRAPVELWKEWDGRWYVGIAQYGYHWGIHGKSALAFAPLYPFLLRLGITIAVPGTLVGLLVSNAAFLGALFYLYRLLAGERGDEIARRTVWLIAVLPTAFFFFAPYSESLFLLTASASLYHARYSRAVWTGLWVGLCILTRPTGIIILPAIAYILWGRGTSVRAMVEVITPPVLAIALYVWYLHTQRLPVQGVLTAQRAWHRGFTFPWTGFVASVQWLAAHAMQNAPWAIENALQLAVTVIVLFLTIMAWRYLSESERLYCAGFWVLVLCSPEWLDRYYAPFSSMNRFVLILFPLYAWVAGHLSHNAFRALLTVSSVTMLGAASVYLAGGWVG